MEECGVISESQPRGSKGCAQVRQQQGGRHCLEHSVIVQCYSASTHALQEAAALNDVCCVGSRRGPKGPCGSSENDIF